MSPIILSFSFFPCYSSELSLWLPHFPLVLCPLPVCHLLPSPAAISTHHSPALICVPSQQVSLPVTLPCSNFCIFSQHQVDSEFLRNIHSVFNRISYVSLIISLLSKLIADLPDLLSLLVGLSMNSPSPLCLRIFVLVVSHSLLACRACIIIFKKIFMALYCF